ncbi:hypothetical protein B0H14DRAFT_2630628 [Mycena olivaceomarginata]|nr:hypothetical protein B0H14DRAFT_2630628 [Mycena olivaceomarginata]
MSGKVGPSLSLPQLRPFPPATTAFNSIPNPDIDALVHLFNLTQESAHPKALSQLTLVRQRGSSFRTRFSTDCSISSTVDEDAVLVAVEQLVVARDISRCQFTGFDSGIAGWIISPESSWEGCHTKHPQRDGSVQRSRVPMPQLASPPPPPSRANTSPPLTVLKTSHPYSHALPTLPLCWLLCIPNATGISAAPGECGGPPGCGVGTRIRWHSVARRGACCPMRYGDESHAVRTHPRCNRDRARDAKGPGDGAQSYLQHLWHGRRTSTCIRVELIAAVYDKALRRKDFSGLVDKDKAREAAERKAELQSTSLKATQKKAQKQAQKVSTEKADDPGAGVDTGKIVNLMAGNQTRVSTIVERIQGFVMLLVGWPLNSYVVRRRVRMHKCELTARDGRMSMVNELIDSTGLTAGAGQVHQVLRVGGALDAREVETKGMIKCACPPEIRDPLIAGLNSLVFFIWALAPILLSTISFLTYVVLGNQLTIGTAFTSITLFGMILAAERHPLLGRVLPADAHLAQSYCPIWRRRRFPPRFHRSKKITRFRSENASLRWNQLQEEQEKAGEAREHSPTASMEAPRGDMIMGARAGEARIIDGAAGGDDAPSWRAHHHVEELSPWLRHQSIQDNIFFGYPYDEARYREVIECCALQPDLDVLEDGDATEIGARGVNLLGGQKARVALARDVYVRSKFVLLDDALSAVLLRGPLLAHRTVILVTRPRSFGSAFDLRLKATSIISLTTLRQMPRPRRQWLAIEDSSADLDDAEAKPKKPRKLVKDEHRAIGGVKWAIYRRYLQDSSYGIWLGLLAVCGTCRAASECRGKVVDKGQFTLRSGPCSVWYQLAQRYRPPPILCWVYVAIELTTVFVSLCSAAAQYTGALWASRKLFRQLLVSVVRATFRFHDTTPLGRILNHFGQIWTKSTQISKGLCKLFILRWLDFSPHIVFPGFLFPAFVLGDIYYRLALGYLNTGRNLRRMESNSRFSDFFWISANCSKESLLSECSILSGESFPRQSPHPNQYRWIFV